ncbi:thioredoxin [Parabacteroides sp. Marseille-P3160]|uniref:thioredoxin n=1 Tax=Parabacteroides sp. Marseille-P3160 TaxID=1917887 RepID=UPI0009B9FD18|nr:thioredoxin [Parabacteroides sp. Marseille-P3160]
MTTHLKLVFLLPFLLIANSCHSANAKDEAGNNEDTGKGEVIALNKSDFLTKVYNYEKTPDQWVYEGDKPCIIDFYADWCGPCRQIAPILKELAKEYQDEIVIYKVNVDQEKNLAYTFGIQSIPATLFVPVQGKPQMSVGALPKDAFVKQIDKILLGK